MLGEVCDAAAEQVSEEELGHLLWSIVVVNSFNRIAISTRLRVGRR